MYEAYERMTVGLELNYGIKDLFVDGFADDIYILNNQKIEMLC